MSERRKRVKQPEIRRFVELLDTLTVIMDSQSVTESVSNILPIARKYGLSAYAAYLDVAGSGMGCRWLPPTAHCKKPVERRGSRSYATEIQ